MYKITMFKRLNLPCNLSPRLKTFYFITIKSFSVLFDRFGKETTGEN